MSRLRSSIDANLPHIISVKFPITMLGNVIMLSATGLPKLEWSPFHILTVLGYDDQNLEFYNSQPIVGLGNQPVIAMAQLRVWLRFMNRGREVTDSLIISVMPVQEANLA